MQSSAASRPTPGRLSAFTLEERTRLAMEAAKLFTWQLDLDGGHLSYSANAADVVGFHPPPETILAEALLHPDDRADFLTDFMKAMSGAPYDREVRLLPPNGGATVWLRVQGRLVLSLGSRMLAGVAQNVTEHRRAEQALRESELRYRELAGKLQEADRRKDEFLAILAHELRNPLAPICNSLDMLREPGTPDETAAVLHRIMDRQARLLVRLVDDLLDVSRITHGTIQLRRELVDIGSIIEDAVQMSRPVIDAQQHQLEIIVPAESLHVRGDATRLTQIVANLLSNAAKYTAPNGRITVRAAATEDEVAIAVRDNGIGLEPQLIEVMFNFFARGADRDGRAPSGLGVGLALARTLAQLHGGSIDGHSDGPGHGSEFTIRLPRVHPARSTATALPERRRLGGAAK